MKKASLILGIFFSVCMIAMGFMYFVLGFVEALVNAFAENGEDGIVIYFMFVCAGLFVLSLTGSILSIKKRLAGGIIMAISTVIFMFTGIYTIIALTKGDALFIVLVAVSSILGILSTLFCFLKEKANNEITMQDIIAEREREKKEGEDVILEETTEVTEE